ncbi:plasmid stabilization protein [Phytomonospora sp. NPDC050363]|uniref:plasmid stabilization protein n=1 Tax=Phytomonospora sp. NPDC050363 TaxID=3155642 RepID=UPI0033C1FCC0
MPKEWTDEQERKYKHIKAAEKRSGRSKARAEQIAAATVNKERARKGQSKTASRSSTKDISSSRRGGQHSHSGPGGRTRDQLYAEAKRRGIEGRSKMNKAELAAALGEPAAG